MQYSPGPAFKAVSWVLPSELRESFQEGRGEVREGKRVVFLPA